MSESDYPKTKSFWSFITNKISPVALAVLLVLTLAFSAGAFGYVLWSQRTIVNLSQENYNLSKASLISQNNHHASTVKAQQAQAALLMEVKQSAAAIQYLGGVIVYQNAQLKSDDELIISAQAQGHALLATVQALQTDLTTDEQSLGGKLTAGQAQINVYLGYLSCITTNMSNQAICGAAPPLPATTPSNAS